MKDIRKISPGDSEALMISEEQIAKIFKKIYATYYDHNLESMGVKKVWQEYLEDVALDAHSIVEGMGTKTLQLVFLAKYVGCFVHKDLISQFVQQFKPDAGLDQQVRHLGSQDYWYILNKGNKVPNTNVTVPSGYQYLVSLEMPNPKAMAEMYKRAGRMAARDFEGLKMAYGNRCATCGIEERRIDPRTGKKVVLQQGHMDPSKPLSLDNTIPQCEYCNETSRDNFIFDENGRIKAIHNPRFVLNSKVSVQVDIFKLLKSKFEPKP